MPSQLIGYVNAAYNANELCKRCSTTGYAFTIAGGIIARGSKTQPTTATSSTKPEFIAAVAVVKIAKYLRSILAELGFPQTEPTQLFENNIATIKKMMNASRPTPRSHYINIQYFAIQDWKKAGETILLHIPGIKNPSDDPTKALSWVMHSRHARHLIRHIPPHFLLSIPVISDL
jgi:hypothetical protein